MKDSLLTCVNIVEMNTAEPSLLAERCLAGDEQAIELFVRTHEAGVFRLALSLVKDPVTAGEITQETFIAALRSLHSYREKSSLKAWLYTIALNFSRSQLRKRKALEKLRATLASILRTDSQRPPSPEDMVIENERSAVLLKALDELDEKHRVVVLLRYIQGLSVAEVAEILSISEGTIHSRLHTARERLRSALSSLHGE